MRGGKMEISSVIEQLLFSTIRIETYDSSNNKYFATSFIFNHVLKNEMQYPFIVTNRHVIKNKVLGKLAFMKALDNKPILGDLYSLSITDFERLWCCHPEEGIDVAVAPFLPLLKYIENDDSGLKIFYKMFGDEIVPSKEEINKLDALEEVIFIGYPSGIWDSKNLLPVIRKGITASSISIDFNGCKQFLIDASVFPGSSGSPVFLYNPGPYREKSGPVVIGSRIMFLGIIAECFSQVDENEIRIISVPTLNIPIALSKQMIDLGIVYKATTILETIDFFLREKDIIKD
jgi:hypothetical protein